MIAALLVATGHLQASGDKLPIPLWVVLAAHSAIALGTISGGWRIVHTLGQRITELRPARLDRAGGARSRPPIPWPGRSPGWGR